MGKRFEGSIPTMGDMLAAYERLGLTNEIGTIGENTAFGPTWPRNEELIFFCVPGNFSSREVAQLLRDAFGKGQLDRAHLHAA